MKVILTEQQYKNLIEGIGDKYLEKKYGFEPEFKEFDKKYRQQLENEKPIGYVYNVPVYKNPMSLKLFDADVRAIADINGNLYVAFHDAFFNHGLMAKYIGLFGYADNIYDYIGDSSLRSLSSPKFLLLHRVKKTNSFGLSDSCEDIFRYNESNYIKIANQVKLKNPAYKIHLKYFGNATKKSNELFENVGDKYAEKAFGIKPEFSDFEDKYKKMSLGKDKEEIIYESDEVTIIKNPKTLNNIGPSVRGIIDKEGNLYVEMKAEVIHRTIIAIIESVLNYRLKPTLWWRELPQDFITVQRDKHTNTFKVGETQRTMRTPEEREAGKSIMGHNYWEGIPSREEAEPIFNEFLNKAKAKNPKFNFSNKIIDSWEQV